MADLRRCAKALRANDSRGGKLMQERDRLFREAYDAGIPAAEIAEPFGLEGQTVRLVARRETPGEYRSFSEVQRERARRPRTRAAGA